MIESITPPPKNVLITGANGLIGNIVFAHLAGQPTRYATFGTARRRAPSSRVLENFYAIPDDHMRVADLSVFSDVQMAVDGMDTVVHMAANADGNAPWDGVLRDNIIASHNVFEASRLAGVKRVIFASTNQVVFGYRDTEPYTALFEGRLQDVDLATYRPILHTQPTRPPNEYAASKVHGEALAHVFSRANGMSCIVLRIGWVTGDDQLPVSISAAARSLWCSQRDIIQIVEKTIDAPASLRHDTFFCQSRNRYNLVDIQHTIDVLGFTPADGAP